MKPIFLKARLNKKNKQVNFCLPKRKVPKDVYDKLHNLRGILLKEDSWDFE